MTMGKSTVAWVIATAVTYYGMGVMTGPFILKAVDAPIMEEMFPSVTNYVTNTTVFVDSSPDTHSNDLYCLAHNIFHEARGESVEGQIQVGYVTMNRVKVKSHGWPDDVCGVVFQRKQFSWTLDKPYVDLGNPGERQAYVRAVNVAAGVLSGLYEDKTEGSTHYYAVNGMKGKNPPWWAESYKTVKVVGNHTFLK